MNEKWFSISVSDIEKKLKTNAASGLSPKAARSRYRKNGHGFYIKPQKRLTSLFGEVLSDFAIALLIISSVIALCFTEYTTGVTLTVIIAINLAACVFLYFKSLRLFESLSDFFRPSVMVIRSGKAFSVDPEHVVVGDVVLLSKGDVLSFDARLVTSDKLQVSVRCDRDTEVKCDKIAEGRVNDGEIDISKMANMVHAGSRIISGSARAIVTAVGRYTYYGAMTGGVPVLQMRQAPNGLKLLKKYCSSFGFVVLLCLLPFSIFSMLFSKGNVTLMTSFTAALAIAASSMAQLACTVCRVFFSHQARCALEGNTPAVLRSPEIMDKLVSSEYLFLLDGSAVSDGVLHFHKAICADGELRGFNAISPSMMAFAELVSLFNSAESRTLTTGVHAPGRFTGALGEFTTKIGVDAEALKIRCNIAGYVPGNSADKTDKLFYTDRGRKCILNVVQDGAAISICQRAYLGNSITSLSPDGVKALTAEYEKYTASGMRVLVFTVSEDEFSDNNIFAGMLVLSENLDANFKAAMSAIGRLGMKIVSFLSSEGGARYDRAELPAPIIGGAASLSDFISNKVDVTYKFGEIDTYRDFSPENISCLIKYIHSMNKKVAVVCFSDTYRDLSEKPDVFITCSELRYSFSGRFEEEVKVIEVPGGVDSKSCRQDVKMDAEVIIPRPFTKGGGLMSLKRAIILCGAAYNNLSGFFRYVLCSQIIRIFMVMLPMIFGGAFLDARHALLCGFIIDPMVMMIFVRERCGAENAKGHRSFLREFKAPIRNNTGILMASALGALCAVILPNIVGSIGIMGAYFYQTEYLFISMILLHITVMYCIRLDNLRRFGTVDINKFAAILDVAAVVFLAICFWIEPIGVFFDVLNITLPYLLLTAIPSVICAALYFVIGNIRIYTE